MKPVPQQRAFLWRGAAVAAVAALVYALAYLSRASWGALFLPAIVVCPVLACRLLTGWEVAAGPLANTLLFGATILWEPLHGERLTMGWDRLSRDFPTGLVWVWLITLLVAMPISLWMRHWRIRSHS